MKGLKALTLLVLALCAVPAFGAHVIGYMKIDGVPGSSKDPAHLGWFELYTFGFQLNDSLSTHTSCLSGNVASFMVAGKPTTGSGETMLRQMCRARTPVALMRVDIVGSATGPHLLHDVHFTACKDNSDGFAADYEAIRYTECSMHHRPPAH